MFARWNLFSQTSSTSKATRLCYQCEKCAARSYQISRQVRRYATDTHRTKDQIITSTIERMIRNTGQIPPIPTEPIVNLPRVKGQSEPRPGNIIRDDLESTTRAQYAANSLAHGNIHVDLDAIDHTKPPRSLRLDTPAPLEKFDEQDGTPDAHQNNGNVLVRRVNGQHSQSRNTIIDTSSIVLARIFDRTKLQKGESFERLDSEILTFANYLRPTLVEAEYAQETWSKFQSLMSDKFPQYTLELHGSRATGLAGPMSDIDVRLANKEPNKDFNGFPSSSNSLQKRRDIGNLQEISKWIRANPKHNLQVKGRIVLAKVPLLEIVDTKTRLTIQIGATNIPTTHTTEFTKYYQHEYPQIKNLFMVLKWWFEAAGLFHAATGGVSSYLLFNMILTSITHSEQIHGKKEYGKHLLQFLEFWSKAPYKTTGFAADPARSFPKFATNIMVEDELQTEDEIHPLDPASRIDIGSGRKDDGLQLRSVDDIVAAMTTDASNVESDSIKDESVISSSQTLDIADAIRQQANTLQQESQSEVSDVYLDGIKFMTRRAQRLPGNMRNRYFLLQDPANPKNNVGAAHHHMKKVQLAASQLSKLLNQAILHWDSTFTYQRQQNGKVILDDLVCPEVKGSHRREFLGIFYYKRKSLGMQEPIWRRILVQEEQPDEEPEKKSEEQPEKQLKKQSGKQKIRQLKKSLWFLKRTQALMERKLKEKSEKQSSTTAPTAES